MTTTMEDQAQDQMAAEADQQAADAAPLLPVEYAWTSDDISGFGGVGVAMKGQRMKLGPSSMGFLVQA